MNETAFLQAKSLYDDGKYQESITSFRQVLRETPEYLDARRFLASALFRSGSFDAAVKEYEILLHSDTPDAWTYYGMGAAQAGQMEWEQAISSYRNALQLDAFHKNSYIGLGLALMKLSGKTKQRSQWEAAKTALETAVSLQPHQQSAKTLAGLANVEWHLGNRSEAIDLAKAATEANPKYSWGWTYLIRFQLRSAKLYGLWKAWQGLLQTKGHFENQKSD